MTARRLKTTDCGTDSVLPEQFWVGPFPWAEVAGLLLPVQ